MNTFDGWNNELYHHGVKGQKWGIRQYQNKDGTLTPEGIIRYRHTFGEALRGVRKEGTPNSNSTPSKLGYIPMRGKKGNAVQRDMAKTQISAERKAAIYSDKARYAEGRKHDRYVKAAKKYVNMAHMTNAMQKRYYELGPTEQRTINRARAAMVAGGWLGGSVGYMVGSIGYSNAMNRLKKNTVNDMKAHPNKYRA